MSRDNFLKWYNESRQKRIHELADQYAKMPDNIRAAVAKVAGVENKRLDDLSKSDRAALLKAASRLVNALNSAQVLLRASQIIEK